MVKRVVVLILASLFLAACGGSGNNNTGVDGDTDQVEEANPLPFEPAGVGAAPDPMEMGPFPVGVTTIDLYDNSRPDEMTNKGRFLRTEVWYPATQAFKDGPFYQLDMRVEADHPMVDLGDKKETVLNADIPVMSTKSIRDAGMDRDHGPYPVVFFSHGCNGIRWQSIFFTIHLASHGYIVISPDHDHNTLWDIVRDGYQGDSLLKSLSKRPDDMTFLLDTFTAYNGDATNFFYQSMDLDKIGISGHSLGGITATIMPCVDPRFDVAILHSPAISVGQLVGSCDPDHYPVPMLVQGGTLDDTLPWCGQYCDYKNFVLGEMPKYMTEVIDGGHFTFSDICRLDLVSLAEEIDLGSNADDALSDGCADFNVPYEKAHKVIDYYATAFLNHYLRGSAASLDYMVEKTEEPFDAVNYFTGDVPDFWGAGGCEECDGL